MLGTVKTNPDPYNGKRIVSIELLRIIATVMIIAHHFSVHGGIEFESSIITVNRLWVQFIELGGKTGVNLFVMITGYFGITAKRRNNLRLVKLWLTVLFYSVTLYLAFVIAGEETFSVSRFIRSVFPVTFAGWWFASAYIALCLFAPFMNTLLKTLSKRDYRILLLIIAFCWCLPSTFLNAEIEGNDLLWFVFIYSLAGYIRLYGAEKTNTAAGYFSLAAITLTLTLSSVVFIDVLGARHALFANCATYFLGMKKLPVLLISVFVFLGFLKLRVKSGALITLLSPAMFGVYLIHDSDLVRGLIWDKAFCVKALGDFALLIPYTIAAVALVFSVCSLIELARIRFLENIYSKALWRLLVFFAEKANKLADRMA